MPSKQFSQSSKVTTGKAAQQGSENITVDKIHQCENRENKTNLLQKLNGTYMPGGQTAKLLAIWRSLIEVTCSVNNARRKQKKKKKRVISLSLFLFFNKSKRNRSYILEDIQPKSSIYQASKKSL